MWNLLICVENKENNIKVKMDIVRKNTWKLKTKIAICKFRDRLFSLRRKKKHKPSESKPQNELNSTQEKLRAWPSIYLSLVQFLKWILRELSLKEKLQSIFLKYKNIIYKLAWVMNDVDCIFKHSKISYIHSKHI